MNETIKPIQFGQLEIDPVAYASMGNAILGIRDSGKTGTGHFFAEQLMEAEIPFISFDPTGVWRWLRVPGAGRGYPVVVAGGQDPDLPLTVDNAVAIVEAAMESGVSLVIDLFSRDMSKANWYRIVERCVTFLMHNNRGLRHLFFEEAAEFVPQRPQPGQNMVYSALESLARMGGNYRLGYTLINQRAEEVNKAVLELCDNLLLHRQKGKNSLTSIGKWLDVGNAQNTKAVKDSFSTLETGMCWAWMRGQNSPELVKVPLKNSAFPKRRALNDDGAATQPARVDVGAFVHQLKRALDQAAAAKAAEDALQAEADGKDVPKPRAMAKASSSPAPAEAPLRQELKAEYDRGYIAGQALARKDGFEAGWAACSRKVVREMQAFRTGAAALFAAGVEPDAPYDAHFQVPRPPIPAPNSEKAPVPEVRRDRVPEKRPSLQSEAPPAFGNVVSEGLTGNQQRVIDAVGWWHAAGIAKPSKGQVCVLLKTKPGGSTSRGMFASTGNAGLTEGTDGYIWLTDTGRKLTKAPPKRPTRDDLIKRVKSILPPACHDILDLLLQAGGKDLDKKEIAETLDVEVGGSTARGYFARLSGAGLTKKTGEGLIAAADWLFTVKR